MACQSNLLLTLIDCYIGKNGEIMAKFEGLNVRPVHIDPKFVKSGLQIKPGPQLMQIHLVWNSTSANLGKTPKIFN